MGLACFRWGALCLSVVGATDAVGQCGPSGCKPHVQRVPGTPREVRSAFPSVVRVFHSEETGSSVGSGTLIHHDDEASYFLTCAHLFGQRGRTSIRSGVGVIRGRVISIDRSNDLALIRTERVSIRPARLGRLASQGLLIACGYGPNGVFRAVSGPITGSARPSGADAPSVRMRGAVRSGDSGGPVFDQEGRLVAVVWGRRGDETYAVGGSPLWRIVSRLDLRPNESPAALASPIARLPGTPAARDQRIEAIERRLEALSERSEPGNPSTPEDLVRRGDLAQLADRWDRRLQQMFRELPCGSASRGEAAARTPLPLSDVAWAVVAIATPTALAAIAGRRLLRSRALRSVAARATPPHEPTRDDSPRTVAIDTPPPPQRIVPETHYVAYENDDFARAHQWASEQLVRKFPGSVELLTSLDSLIRQKLNGADEPA